MELFFQFFLLVVGLVLLWKTGELSVRYALGFSTIHGIARFSVGFFIFAISTGLPEISSAIIASLKKIPELSVGDLLGSSLINLTLILGIVAIYAKEMQLTTSLKRQLLKTSLLILILIGLFIWLKQGYLTLGILLILLYFGSNFWLKEKMPEIQAEEEIEEIQEEIKKLEKNAILSPKWDVTLRLFGSLALLLVASWITVHAATKLSALMDIDLTLLGGTILAIGTSIPELVLELHAIRKKEYALALGDLFGSSLLNISFILGLLMLLNENLKLSYAWKLLPFFVATLIWTAQALFRKSSISRKDGFFFLLIFLAYLGLSLFSHFSVA